MKLGRGPLRDTLALSLLVSEKNFNFFFFVPMLELVDPEEGRIFTPGSLFEKNLVKVLQETLHTKYQISAPYDSNLKDLTSFCYVQTFDPQGQGQF